MKKAMRLIALLGALILILSLSAGCAEKEEPYAIKVGDVLITEAQYARTIQILRSQYLANLGQDESTALWETEINDKGMTLSEGVVQAARNQLVWIELYKKEFDRLGLTLSDEEVKAINSQLEATVNDAGGLTEFYKLLEQQGYTYDEYKEELFSYEKKTKVLGYYFGPQGKQKPTTDQDIKDWYNVNNARIKVLCFLTQDPSTGMDKGSSQIQKAKQQAQEALESATRPSQNDLFDEVVSIYYDDQGYDTQASEFVVNENNGYDPTLTQAALEMKVGEVRLVEIETGYTLVKRYDGTADQYFTDQLRQETLETIRAQAIEDLMAAWEQDHTVTVNEAVTKNYRPEVLWQKELDARS